MSTIADRIKEICAQKGTSMYKLEKQLNLGNGTIGKWGKNGRQPTYDKAVAVANALGVSADYLLTGEQKEKAPAESSERMSDDELKFALWGDSTEMDDADLDDVKRYAAFIRERKKGK